MIVEIRKGVRRGCFAPSSAQGEPYRRLARRRRRSPARGGGSFRKPPAPVWARDVADVGDRPAAKLQRAWHAPARHNKFAVTIRAVAHDRRVLVGEDPGECSKVAGPLVGSSEQGANGGLPFDFRLRLEMWGIVGLLRRVQCLLGIKQGVR